MSFADFFKSATGHDQGPFDYQRRLACGERGNRDEAEWLAGGTDCNSRLINIPTGLGKTAAVVLAWLWNRVALQIENPQSEFVNRPWPRRLVYCLPMRTLVEQTEDEVQNWLKAHDLAWNASSEIRRGKVGVNVLIGGEEAGEWDIYPEENAILSVSGDGR